MKNELNYLKLARDFLKSPLSLTKFAVAHGVKETTLRRNFNKLSLVDKELYDAVRRKVSTRKTNQEEVNNVIVIANYIIKTALPLKQVYLVMEKLGIIHSYSTLKDIVHQKLPATDVNKYKLVKEIISRSTSNLKYTKISDEGKKYIIRLILNKNFTLNEVVRECLMNDINEQLVYEYIFNTLKKTNQDTYIKVIDILTKDSVIEFQGYNENTEKIIEVAKKFTENIGSTSTRNVASNFGVSNVTIWNYLEKLKYIDSSGYILVKNILNGNKPATIKDENVYKRVKYVAILVLNGFTVNEISLRLNQNPTVIYRDINNRLDKIDITLYQKVKKVLKNNSLNNIKKTKQLIILD